MCNLLTKKKNVENLLSLSLIAPFSNYHAYLVAYCNLCVPFPFVEGKIEISERLYGIDKEA
jgi:hypothetical protein